MSTWLSDELDYGEPPSKFASAFAPGVTSSRLQRMATLFGLIIISEQKQESSVIRFDTSTRYVICALI
jgi:hypothetical protein